MIPIRENETGISFQIRVLPRSSRCAIAGIQEGALKLKITAPPVEGQANEACIQLLADVLGIGKTRIAITAGHNSRRKTVFIEGLKRESIASILPSGTRPS